MRTVAAILKDDEIFFSTMLMNGIFSLDLKNDNRVKYLNCFEEEKGCAHLYRRAYSYNNNIWFVPENAKNVAKYNIITNEVMTYEYNYHKFFDNNMFRYSDSFVFEEKYLCLVPGNTDSLVIINMETGKEKIIYDVIDPSEESYISGTYVNGCVWLCPFNSESLCIVDLKTNQIKRHKWKYVKESFDGVCAVGNNIYFAPHKSNVFCFIDTVNMMETAIDITEIKNQNEKFQGIFRVQNELWCMPFTAKYFIRYNLDKEEVYKYVTNYEELFKEWEWNTNNYMPVSLENNFIIASCFTNSFYIYNKEIDEFNSIEIKEPKVNIKEYYENYLKKGIILNLEENGIVRELDGMLSYFCSNIEDICDITTRKNKK